MKASIFFKTNIVKAFMWFIGNAAFALAPLLAMMLLHHMAPGKSAAKEEISNAVRSGVIFFVASALMGAVVIDILIEGIKIKGAGYFIITILPFVVLVLNLFIYTLVACGILIPGYYSTGSGFNIFTIIFSVPYCLIAKYYLYKNGGLK